MAAPYLTGCIALLQQYGLITKGRFFTYEEVKRELIKYAVDLGIEGVDPEFGYGMVNIGKIGVAAATKTTVKLDQPMILDSQTWRTLAPLRFIVEVNGGQILSWDNNSRTIVFLTSEGKQVTMQVNNPEVIIEDIIA
jgi:hypothetical protein